MTRETKDEPMAEGRPEEAKDEPRQSLDRGRVAQREMEVGVEADTLGVSVSPPRFRLPPAYGDRGPALSRFDQRIDEAERSDVGLRGAPGPEQRDRLDTIDPADLSVSPSKFVITLFEGVLTGTAADHGTPGYEDALGYADDLAIVIVATQVTGVGTTLSVQLEHSGDGQSWIAKNSIPELNQAALSTTAATTLLVNETRRSPSLGFVRVRLQLAATSGTPSARLSVKAACGWRRIVA